MSNATIPATTIPLDGPDSTEKIRLPDERLAHLRRRGHTRTFATFLIGIVLSSVTIFFVARWEEMQARKQFESLAQDRFDALQNGLNQYLDKLVALRALFEANQEVTRETFEVFANRLMQGRNAIQTLTWVPRIARNERAAHELAGIRDGIPGYRIKAILDNDTLAPSPERDEYLPIFYSSQPKTSPAYGMDLLSVPKIRERLDRARDNDQLSVVPDVMLLSKAKPVRGFIFSLPLYRRGRPMENVEERRRNLVGFIHGAFFAGEMMDGVLHSLSHQPSGIDVYLFLANAAPDSAPLYVYNSRLRITPAEAKSPSILTSSEHAVGTLSAGAETFWTLVAVPIAGGPLSARHDRAWLVFVASILATIGLTSYVGSSVRHADRLQRANKEISDLAWHDPLTGLYNRRAFNERLAATFAASRRSKRSFAVHYFDLDHFKDVNDTLGHPAGDDLLQQVTARVRNIVRHEDCIARFGGDEFAILQMDSDVSTALKLATRINESLALPFVVWDNEVHITASIGIAPYSTKTTSPDALIMQADIALYRAKHEGRNCFKFHSADLDREILERVSISEDLHKAIERGELYLHYQPQVEIPSGRIVGVEALMRWHHPSRGWLSPAQFIPIAEQAGRIAELGAWAFDEACHQMRSWCDRGLSAGVMAVNVTASQFRASSEFEDFLAATLKKWGIEPFAVEIELTETELMEVTKERSHSLKRLRELGLRVAIDDFGTGYSSLTYLANFPVNRLKIAQELVLGVLKDTRNVTVVRSAIRLAEELGIDCVAEGVENAEQVKFLIEAGCRFAQGYYYGKPLSAELMTAHLEEHADRVAQTRPRLELVTG